MARTKRVLPRRTDVEDHLSKLPESLIVRILSCLPMKDAVKTDELSKSWKNIWNNVDNVVYEFLHDGENDFYHNLPPAFRKVIDDDWLYFIDRTITQCKAHIKTFSLAGRVDFHPALLDKWISHVLDKNVETLKLNINSQFPDCLFNSSSITNLELVHGEGNLNASATVNLSKLKSLLLDDAKVDDAFMDRILIGSPVLENLVIRNSTRIRHLNIMSPRVKILKLLNIGGKDAFEIRAPWLRELEISGHFTFSKCEIVDVSSLLKSTITFKTRRHGMGIFGEDWGADYNYRWSAMVTKLLESLSYAGELIIGSYPIQALTFLKLSGTPSPVLMCKHLTINTSLMKFDIPGIAGLLEHAPHLETLLIEVLPFSCGHEVRYTFREIWILFENGDPHLNMPHGEFPHLKNVEIEYSQMSCNNQFKNNDGRFFDFELMEYILKSATVLEKMVLCSSRGRSCGNSWCLEPNCLYQYVSSLRNKLINLMGAWELKKIQ